VTVPLPAPDVPVSTLIHDALDTAVHAQPAGNVTSTLPFPPAATTLCVVGVSVAVQAAPACVMTNGWPATVIVVERELLFGFAATAYPTLPLPDPDAAVLNVTHDAGLVAVQLHVPPAVTAIVPVLDDALTDALAGEML